MWGKSGAIRLHINSVNINGTPIRLTGDMDTRGETGTAGVVGAIVVVPLAGFFVLGPAPKCRSTCRDARSSTRTSRSRRLPDLRQRYRRTRTGASGNRGPFSLWLADVRELYARSIARRSPSQYRAVAGDEDCYGCCHANHPRSELVLRNGGVVKAPSRMPLSRMPSLPDSVQNYTNPDGGNIYAASTPFVSLLWRGRYRLLSSARYPLRRKGSQPLAGSTHRRRRPPQLLRQESSKNQFPFSPI